METPLRAKARRASASANVMRFIGEIRSIITVGKILQRADLHKLGPLPHTCFALRLVRYSFTSV